MSDEMEFISLSDFEEDKSHSKYKKDKLSRLLVACKGDQGVVLDWVGNDWFWWREGCGTDDLTDCGLEGAPDGLSIWEGKIKSWGPSREGEYDAEPRGTFRVLTDTEWELLKKDEPLWDEKEWLDLEFKENV